MPKSFEAAKYLCGLRKFATFVAAKNTVLMSNSANNNADNQAAGNNGVFHFQDAKHIMAAYLNMAGDHLMRTVDYVLGRVNLTRNDVVSKSTDKPEAVLNGLKKRLKKNQGVPSLGAEGEARLRELLFTHFPMLEMLADMDTVKDNKAETVDKDNNYYCPLNRATYRPTY